MFGYTWLTVKDGDSRAYAIFRRHYSFHEYRDNRRRSYGYRGARLFVGPGEKLVLITPELDALFIWRYFIDDSGQKGVNCAAFRNEGKRLSSFLIREAETLAWNVWTGERLYTYINPFKIKSTNPGYCFLKAGWNKCPNVTKVNRLIILEKLPPDDEVQNCKCIRII